jgi:hypothetical protein
MRTQAAADAQQKAKAADKDVATATARLESLATDLRDAARDGVLPTEHTDPAAHDAILAEQHDTLTGILDGIRGRREQRPQARTELPGKLTALTGEQVRLTQSNPACRGPRAPGERPMLAAHGRLRDLTEATRTRLPIWRAESDTLTRRLSDAILSTTWHYPAEAERRRSTHPRRPCPHRAAAHHARCRARCGQRRHGITAETGWAHLRT